MASHPQAGGPADSFTTQLNARGRQSEAPPGARGKIDPELLLDELESVHRELRVACEEARSQRAEVARLLESDRTGRRQRERLVAVLPVPVVVTDAGGLIRSGNAAAASVLNVRVDRFVGRPLSSFVLAEHRPELRRRLSAAVSDGSSFRQVVSLAPRRGMHHSIELVANVSRDAARDAVEVTWVLLGSDGGAVQRLPALHRPTVTSALVELSELPLHRIGRAASVRRVAEICGRALGTDTAVSVTVGPPLEPELVATTSKLAQLVDGAQMVSLEGPAVKAWEEQGAVKVGNLATDARWPRFAALATPTGLRSVLSLPITTLSLPVTTGEDLLGVLNVYSAEVDSFDGALGIIAEQLVAAMAAVLREIDLNATLEGTVRALSSALESRATIEQAKGVIMTRAGVDADEAFARLVKMSRDGNVKLRVLAARIVQEAAGGRRGA